jgi:uncharacterized RDD family membrane protein YckC
MAKKEYAGFWIRTGASLIDMLVLLIVMHVPLNIIYGQEYWSGDKVFYGVWHILLGYVLPICGTIWLWQKYLATLGKLATKLKIVDAITGEKMIMRQSIVRYFAYIPAIVPLGLGLIWVGIDSKKQGWHDKIAGTVVIQENQIETVNNK